MFKYEVEKLYKPERIEKTITTREYKEKYVDRNITLKACKECPNYSQNWACPKFNEDIYGLWDEYDNLKLILTKINFTQEALEKTYDMEELGYIIENTLFGERKKLITTLEEYEKQKNGRYLSAGFCSHCEKCSRLDGEKCRFPEKCRYSIESIGGLVSETLDEIFDEKLKWIDMENGKLPENLSLLMGLLY